MKKMVRGFLVAGGLYAAASFGLIVADAQAYVACIQAYDSQDQAAGCFNGGASCGTDYDPGLCGPLPTNHNVCNCNFISGGGGGVEEH